MATLEQEKVEFQFRTKRQEEFFKVLDKAIEDKIELFSFDVFDTLITRTTVTPSGIFALMQHELMQNPEYDFIDRDFRSNFYDLRTGAENYPKRTRRTVFKKANITEKDIRKDFFLEEFYDILKYHHGIDEKTAEILIKLELETEYKNSLPLKENIEALKYLISKGQKVILISDMYLRQDKIRNLLLKHDEIFKDIKIYTSCENQATKGSGDLYKVVKNNENIEYNSWLHIGDNKKVDIERAQKLSIKTHYIEKEKLTEFEENIFKTHGNDPYFQVIIGNAINTRRFYPDNEKADFATIGTIMLFPYVKWVINQSIQKGIERLYFIARDGYILQKIADVIIKEENLNITTHYIYGSRDAWRMPCVESFEDLWFLPTLRKSTASVKQLSEYLNIDESKLKQFLPKYYKKINTTLPYDHYLGIFSFLESNQEFMEYILEKNKEQKLLLKEYLKQEINCDNENYAFVDLTASGVSIDLIAKQIYKLNSTKSKVFIYSRHSNFPCEYSKIYSYVLQSVHILVEFLGRAPHGQTMSYKKEGDKVAPVLSNHEITEKFEEYAKVIELYSKLYQKTFEANSLCNQNMLFKIYQKNILNAPTKEIIDYFTNIPFESIGADKFKRNNKITIKELLDHYFFSKKRIYKNFFDMSIKISPIHIRCLACFFENLPVVNFKIFKKIKYTYKTVLGNFRI